MGSKRVSIGCFLVAVLSCVHLFNNQTREKLVYIVSRGTFTAGFKFSPNCGLNDFGGRQESLYQACQQGTFNDGTFLDCRTCKTCPEGLLLKKPCTSTNDSICCSEGYDYIQGECRTTPVSTPATTSISSSASPPVSTSSTNPVTTSALKNTTTISHPTTHPTTHPTAHPITHDETPAHSKHLHHSYLTEFSVVLFILLICVCVLLVILKRKFISHREIKTCFRKRSVKTNQLCKSDSTNELNYINNLLCPEIQAAPLQTVLDNLDVVEELVLLLDPETPGAKNTRHLAASCSLPFTWINYVYSMKASRSPLVSVLERLIAKNPYWSVGHFAGLLSNIGRNDAVAVLGKMTLVAEDMQVI